ncbi:MAG: ATP-binding protein [Planctomycetes bacterium]|nr:ATP-binding protein [Planctomycetota bacterium]
MERAFFEKLLYEEESPTLDVKSRQYPFANAKEDQKSELLKDILGFVNAWRRSDAYILIGVEEVRGGLHKVIGITATEQLADHSLQQFVNSLTNRPVRLQYEAFEYEGKQVGIIRIEQQPHPVYLKKKFGKLKKEQVYVRRGSSTDPSKPASPEEIALMGQMAGPQSAQLSVEFADTERDTALGAKLTWDAELLQTPPFDQIPDLELPPHRRLSIGLPAIELDPSNMLNRNYLRALANFEWFRRLFRPVRLVVRNEGDVAAKGVRCELATPADTGVVLLDAADRPDAPRRHYSVLQSAAIKGIKPQFRRTPGEVTIDKNDERYLIEIEFGDLQPGRRVWSDMFYAGKGESGEFELAGQIYAANLPQPKKFMLAICAKVSGTTLTVNDLRELPEPPA